MNSKPKVSIGIPAYNEEANIQQLLRSLINQKQDNIELLEIIVVSDASTDSTVQRVREIGDKRIIILENKVRVGQALGQNEIVKIFTGDVLVLLNADIIPKTDDFLEKIVKPILQSEKVGIVCPELIPLKASTLFEKIINYSVSFKKEMFAKFNQGNNLLMCAGGARAFPAEFARHIRWPASVSEDAYSYLYCINQGYKFVYLPLVAVYFKSPDNLRDHLKQSTRFSGGPSIMSDYFSKKFVDENYTIPLKIKLEAVFKFFFMNPGLFLAYFFIYSLSKALAIVQKKPTGLWKLAISTKKLN